MVVRIAAQDWRGNHSQIYTGFQVGIHEAATFHFIDGRLFTSYLRTRPCYSGNVHSGGLSTAQTPRGRIGRAADPESRPN